MTIARNTFTALLAILGLAVTGQAVQAAPNDHMDRHAVRLRALAAQAVNEVRIHYRHTPQYGHLISDAREIYAKADHIHRIAHRGVCPSHLLSDLNELDRLFHHTGELIRQVELRARHGHGHVDGDTRHMRILGAQMAQELHQMMAEVNRPIHPALIPGHGGVWHGGPHGPGHGGPHGGVHLNRSGIRFGNRRFSFRIGF